MLKWHLENPVTNREIYRNNTVHTLQKNRNPFIDKPQYACAIWGNENSTTQSLCASQEEVDVTSVSVSPNTSSISLQSSNKSVQLSANVLPSNASNKVVTWTSSNTNIATVTSSGYVTAKAVGSATITAISTADGTKKGTATITVTNDPIAVTGVNITDSTMTLGLGKTQALSAIVEPNNATNKNVTWLSSNASIVSVTSSGQITGKAVGTANITVKTVDGNFSDTIAVTVNEIPAVTSVTGLFYNSANNSESQANAYTVNDLNNGKSTGITYVGFGGEKVVASYVGSQSYLPRAGGLTLGSSSNPGYIDITLEPEYATKRIEVIFNDAGQTSTPSLVNNGPGTGNTTNGTIGTGYPSNGTPYVLTTSEATTEFRIAATKRLAIVEIHIIIESDEPTDYEMALAWSEDFLDDTLEGCLTSDSSLLYSAWQLAEDEYQELNAGSQEILRSSVPDSDGSVIEHARARYLVIMNHYGFNDFMNEIYSNDVMEKVQHNNVGTIIFVSVIITISIVAFKLIRLKEKDEIM